MNKEECIEALMWKWGISKKEAERQFETNSYEFNYRIWKIWRKEH